MTTSEIKERLKTLANPEKAEILQRFFKTGPGEYGEGDVFLGIKVPVLRKLAKEYLEISLEQAGELIDTSIHEQRQLSLFILVYKFAKADEKYRKKIYDLYLNNTRFINNWDLVDCSAEHIVGSFLTAKSKKPLYTLVKSRDLWKRRISILSTFHFIKQKQFADTLKIAELLLQDNEDLIHKAVGWMLREVGKRDMEAEETFLKEHYKKMPRTMLRYAIEKFPEQKRQAYLKGKI